ncbi:hypothetical protein EXIGLDRAFT_735192 [Exidia glandulosa HHB12029]|uniref:F-box domain-containing protein n=1 Tax=Exidia glandulosa HHB12029 TaxID=1314781 RepID=A0A165JX86_EXIGL|nr:hypothetical protein EXIGLDRAFT_735192 [Exidia glandulosa HHB12029]
MNALDAKLLSRIFTFAASDAVAVSHVSRYWRAIALQTPQLWSTLTTDLGPIAATVFLERSQDAPLDIHIELSIAADDAYTRIRMFMQYTLPHVSRWRSFVVDVPIAAWMNVVLECCVEGLAGRTLELDLLSLRVNSNEGDYGYGAREAPPVPVVPLPFAPRSLVLDAVPTWHPALFSSHLVTLDVRNHTPPAPALGSSGKPSYQFVQSTMTDMASFLTLLHGAPNLQSLHVASSTPTPSRAPHPSFTLPYLDTLVVRIVDAPTLASLLEHVTLPALTTLDITWAGREQQGISSFLSNLGPLVPHLHTLRIATVAQVPPLTWSTLFAHLPALTHLALEATGANIDVLSTLVNLPRLASLTLRHQDDLTLEALEALAVARMGRPGIEPLQYLEVAWCERVQPDDAPALRTVVPHVVVRDVDDEDDDDLEYRMEEMDLDGSGDSDSADDDDDDEMDEDEDDEDDIKAELEFLRELVLFPLFPPEEKTLTWTVPISRDNRVHGNRVHGT